MAQQTSNEIKNKNKTQAANSLAASSIPYLAIVVPKTLEKQALLALPAYWLQSIDNPIPKELTKPVVTILARDSY